MASNRKDLKAYVRYDGTGRVISGGPILSRVKPKVGNWVEIDPYLCCNTSSGCITNKKFAGYFISDSGSEFWDDVGGQSVAIDDDCNTYFSYWDSSYAPIIPMIPAETYNTVNSILKRDKNGNLLWNNVLLYPDSVDYFINSTGNYNYIQVDKKNKVIYSVGNAGSLTAMDLDGNVLYCKLLNKNVENPSGLEAFYWFANMFAISPDGAYLYITGGGRKYLTEETSCAVGFILKIDAATGAIIKQVDITLSTLDAVQAMLYGAACDKDGNVFVSPYFSPGSYNFTMKLDSDLNELWKTQSVGLYVEDPVIDLNGDLINIFVDGTGTRAICKFDGSTGNLLWSSTYVSSDPDFNNASFWDRRIGKDNGIYLGGIYTKVGDMFNLSFFAKINTDGTVIENAYRLFVNNTTYTTSYWGYGSVQGPVLLENNPLQYALSGSPWLAIELKLGLGNYNGTYGDFTFVSVLNTSSVIPYAPIFSAPPTLTYSVETYIGASWDPAAVGTTVNPRIFNIQTLS